jgi:2-oxo-4-hydroxy-4-carboxy-5-ureidoimidazoline decarboxylase
VSQTAETGRPAEPEQLAWFHRLPAADEPTRQAIAELNAAYEERFGHIYLVCATGRTAAELLALLQARLGHDDAAEWSTVRSELQQINRIRLRKLLAGAA